MDGDENKHAPHSRVMDFIEVGSTVEAFWREGQWFPAKITLVNIPEDRSAAKCSVKFLDDGVTKRQSVSQETYQNPLK